MKKAVLSVLFLALVIPAPVAAAAGPPTVVDRVVAVVNGEIITLSDLQREAARLGGSSLSERDMLDEMINRKLQLDAARKHGLDVTDKELDEALQDIMKRNTIASLRQFEAVLAREGLTLSQYRAELREQMTLSRVFNKFVRSGLTVDEGELRAYYERNLPAYTLPEEFRVRQIVISLPPSPSPSLLAAARQKARTAADRALRGDDFTALVRAFSDDPSAATDGDLGFLALDHMLPEIASAVKHLSPGEIAGPLEGPTGIRIIRLEESRRPIKAFSDVRDEIAAAVLQQKIETAYRSWLQSLRTDATIDFKL